MKFSKHNIFSGIKDSDNYYIVNLLTGNADILEAEKAKEILNGQYAEADEYIGKGYLSDESEEKKLYIKKYLDFVEQRETDEIQLFFVPWYACNFSCSYCYQTGYENEKHGLSQDVTDAFFSYIDKEFKGRRKYITIFGGEPLLPSSGARETIQNILEKAHEASTDIAIVTNGYNLEEYVPLLKTGRIREIQVTLDGVGATHDERRPLTGGGATFDKIVRGIDSTLNNNISVNLRVVIDKENISSLSGLAKFAIEKGWTKNPLFKTQLGRNYELHYCQSGNSRLFSRLEFYESIYNEIKKHPYIIEFHKPAFSIARFLFENGELPQPLFDSCTGCKTEWAFDYSGNIYSCTATVGKQGSSLGTFYPEITKRNKIIAQWENRDVTSISECHECSFQLACGGGCAAVAFNRAGKLDAPDCRPIKDLLSMGISHYFKKELE
ncbi:MAG: radical SAM protein [Ignavibacteria bacterium]